MSPVFVNSAFVHAPERLVLRGGRWIRVALKVRYGVIRHPSAGLVLVDTGYTEEVLRGDHRSLALRAYAKAFGPDIVPKGQPAAALKAMGYDRGDVTEIIITHFHPDHISGLRQFSNARFVASGQAYDSLRRSSSLQNTRHGVFPELLPDDFDARFEALEGRAKLSAGSEFGEGYDLFGDGSTVSIDLPGHAVGQFGLLFPQEPTPLLYAVDTQWMMDALDENRAPGFPATLVAEDGSAARQTIAKVRRFRDAGGEVVLSHDPGTTTYDLP
jgi:glyoxylase-like metal-dependent hydrolase (beta-lactamase superfamily II)